MKEKKDFDQLAEGLQKQMMTAVTMAVQKLETANHKSAAQELEIAELKIQISHLTSSSVR
jgi:hypothetical protein